MNTKQKAIAGVVVLGAVFLIGFLPQYLSNRGLRQDLAGAKSELATAQQRTELDEARTLAGRVLLAAARQNYGMARDHSAMYFDKLRELEAQSEEPLRTSLQELLALRDSITAMLAQGDPSIVPELYSLLERTYDLPNPEPPSM